jgi:hypothetical protein
MRQTGTRLEGDPLFREDESAHSLERPPRGYAASSLPRAPQFSSEENIEHIELVGMRYKCNGVYRV